MTSWTGQSQGRRAARAAVVFVLLAAGALPLLSPSVLAATEYRYEIVLAPPTPLDYKGVAWATDGSAALVVGGIQAVLRYDGTAARQVAGSNWSSSSQTIEEVAYGPDGTGYVCGGRLNGSKMSGDVWSVTGAGIAHLASVDGDMLTAISVSAAGRVLVAGSVGNVYELAAGSLKQVGKAGDVSLNDLAWAPDGSGAFIVGSPGVVRWFDAATGTLSTITFAGTSALNAISWRPGTTTAWATGEGGVVLELNATSMSAGRVRPSTPRSPDLFGIAWNPLGDRALLVGAGGTTQLWRLGVFTQQSVDVSKDLLDCAWSPTDDVALVTGVEGTLLRFAPRLPPQNAAPTAVITSPSDGTTFQEGTTVTFDGSKSSDPEGDPLTFTWVSNQTGAFGSGAVVHAALPVGTHAVTLHVDDGQGHNSTATVSIAVERPVPPEQLMAIEVNSPASRAIVSGIIVVTGRATYAAGPLSSVEVAVDDGEWRMATGVDPFSMSIDTVSLQDGIHELNFRATAADGTTKETSLLVEVRNAVPPPPPKVPNVTLRLRDRGLVDEPLRFEAFGVDASKWDVVWTFGDGSRGEGLEVLHVYSDAGRYDVTLLLFQPGGETPVASYTATVIVDRPSSAGPSLEGLAVLATVVAVGLYLAGFYVGRRVRGGGDG